MIYLLGFAMAAGASAALMPWIRRYALSAGIVDSPSSSRKIHKQPVAYLGGVGIFVAFVAASLALVPMSRQLAALLAGCLLLVVVGVIDDIKGLSPWTKLVWQVVAACIALAGGIGVTVIRNPFGGVIDFTVGRFAVDFGWLHFHIAPLANLLSIIWMVGLANTVNFLDGLDGLAGGVSGISALIMFMLSIGPNVHQPLVALLAIILAGAAFGFLPYNFYPARIFMGDSGSLFLGLTLAMLAIYSGAKLATAALVLGFPIVDAVWSVIRRLASGKSPFSADRRHFHHLLIDAGMNQRQAVLTLYAVALAFGTVALMVGSLAKLIALIVLTLLMALAITGLVLRGYKLSKSAR